MSGRCHCGRFLANLTVPVVAVGEGFSAAYAAGCPEGTCAAHGRVKSTVLLSWDEAFGDWDPEADL